MIRVIKMGKGREEFYINPALIETIETKPDTIITLINGKKYIVADTLEELLANIQNYYKVAGLIPPQVIFNSYDFNNMEDYLS